jgi:hypothetical protein
MTSCRTVPFSTLSLLRSAASGMWNLNFCTKSWWERRVVSRKKIWIARCSQRRFPAISEFTQNMHFVGMSFSRHTHKMHRLHIQHQCSDWLIRMYNPTTVESGLCHPLPDLNIPNVHFTAAKITKPHVKDVIFQRPTVHHSPPLGPRSVDKVRSRHPVEYFTNWIVLIIMKGVAGSSPT